MAMFCNLIVSKDLRLCEIVKIYQMCSLNERALPFLHVVDNKN